MIDRDELRAELDELARDAERRVRRATFHDAAAEAFRRGGPVLLALPALLFVRELLRLAVGAGPASGLATAVIAAALGFGLWVGGAGLWAARAAPTRRRALARVDEELDLEDRLTSADEFLDFPGESAFVEAALEDGASRVAAARAADLSFARDTFVWTRPHSAWAAAAFLLAVLVGAIAGVDRGVGATEEVAATSDAGEAAVLDVRPQGSTPDVPPVSPEEPERDDPREASREMETSSSTSSSSEAPGDDAKETQGRTVGGRSSEARAASGRSDSQGAPSQQGQTTQSADPERPENRPPSSRPPSERRDEQQERRQEEDSGSTSGRGSSRGSNRNTMASDWSSKDQVTTPEDEEVDDDEETEDEDEEQESRGGMQPNLRDRRPPVSRDLRIGFGNQPNPDANGRGGPSENKKSRGVASLVLGVPIPDRIKGQPNPGRTKVTQELIEPRAQESELSDLVDPSPRSGPIGPVAQPELEPWMRELVAQYFLSRRNETPNR